LPLNVVAPNTCAFQCASQAWLQSLVAAGISIPDGAAAHVLVNDQHMKAVWQQHDSSWMIDRSTATPVSPRSHAPPQLSVVYADQPVVRLTRGGGGHHHTSLLLQVQHAAAPLQFMGSDAHSVASQLISSDGASVIHCAARGSWGGSLPVSVMCVESEALPEEGAQAELESEAPSSLTKDDATLQHVLVTVGGICDSQTSCKCFFSTCRLLACNYHSGHAPCHCSDVFLPTA
jgi:hypothetical protein